LAAAADESLSLIAFNAVNLLAASANVPIVKFIHLRWRYHRLARLQIHMLDDLPLDAPSHHRATPSEPTPEFEVWRLGRGGHLLICELRNDVVSIDVVTFEAKRSPLLFQRCTSHAHAQFMAMGYRRMYVREGWIERR